jgi:hypothetical protein
MSPDSEDTALEEALRDDLPSAETSARLRRRLLAAGLAIGNGAAASTAAAAAGASAGVASKGGLALSWGFKLGALAVVAIPSVGLLVESQSEPQLAPPPSSVAAPAGKPRSPERATLPAEAPAPELALAGEAEPVAPPVARPARAESSERSLSAPARHQSAAAAPSQVDFATIDAASVPSAASTLAEETRLLDSAFAELSAGRATRARELVAEHQRRFPNGLLQKERERARARLTEMSRGE